MTYTPKSNPYQYRPLIRSNPEAYESFKRQYKENKARREEEQSKSSLDQKLREAGL